MFSLRILRAPVNLNYSQFRQLRKITKATENLLISNHYNNNKSSLNVVNPIISNPFKTSYDDESRSSDISITVKKDKSSVERFKDKTSVLEKFAPTFNLGAYLSKSESLQQLFKLGVDFSQIEKRKGLGNFVLKLDFENDIKPHLQFLNDIGILAEDFGELITKNPLIFKITLDDLKTRVNYLESKNFTNKQITRICTKDPFWLMFSTKRIDKRLGYFQTEFKLSGDDLRFLATKQPKLITYRMENIQENTFSIKEEMGFDKYDMKCLLLSKPKLWMMKVNDLVERFDYVHNKMAITHDLIIQFPEILTSREYRIRQRHEFLLSLGKAQYDPTKDLYVSLKTLVEGNDREFVTNVAKTDMRTYDKFLKTL